MKARMNKLPWRDVVMVIIVLVAMSTIVQAMFAKNGEDGGGSDEYRTNALRDGWVLLR